MAERVVKWWLAKPPSPHQKGWKKIVDAGCQGTYDSYTFEYDCCYAWACEKCPVYLQAEEKRQEEFVGPLEPGFF